MLTGHRNEQIAGVFSCYDRLLIQGARPGLCYAEGMTGYLKARQIRIFDYTRRAQPLCEVLQEKAERLADTNAPRGCGKSAQKRFDGISYCDILTS